MERLFRDVPSTTPIDDIPTEQLDFMLDRRFAEGMARKHTRARRRFQNVILASEPRGHVPVQYSRALDNRIATLSSRDPHPPEADFWKSKWLKATVIFLRELARVLRTEEKAMKQVEVQPKAVPIRRQRATSKLSAKERRDRDKEGEAGDKVEKIVQSLTSAATTTVPGPDNHPSTLAAPVRKIEQTFTRMRSISRLRASVRSVRLAAKREQRTGHRIRYHSRLRERVGIVTYLSKSAVTATKQDPGKGRRSRNHPSTSVAPATKRTFFIGRRFRYTSLPGRSVRRVRSALETLYKPRLDEQRNRRNLAHRKYVVGREKESLWTTMRAVAKGGTSVSAPTSHRCRREERLMEHVRGYLNLDTTPEETPVEYRDEDTPDEYREGEYKPFKGEDAVP